MKLHFAESLLERGRTLQQLGLHGNAARIYQRLTGLRDLPADIAEASQRHLAEIHLEQGRYRLARRCLAAALVREPDEPYLNYLMGLAVLDDPRGDARRALVYFGRAIASDADNAEYHVQHGLLALALDKPRLSLRSLRRAAELAPDDPEILSRVVEGLRDAGKQDEARSLLRAALFRHPRDQRFRNLWNRHQFDLLYRQQQDEKTTWVLPQPEPVILRFVQPRKRVRVGNRTVRRDGPHKPATPKIIPARLTSRKKAK